MCFFLLLQLFSAPISYLFSFNHSWQAAFLPPTADSQEMIGSVQVEEWASSGAVLMEAPAPGDHQGTPLPISVDPISLGFFHGGQTYPFYLVGSSVKPLWTVVVEGVNHTCPDFLTGSKTSHAHFREVSDPFHPVRKDPKRHPAAFRGHSRWGRRTELLRHYPQHNAAQIYKLLSERRRDRNLPDYSELKHWSWNVKYHIPVARQAPRGQTSRWPPSTHPDDVEGGEARHTRTDLFNPTTWWCSHREEREIHQEDQRMRRRSVTWLPLRNTVTLILVSLLSRSTKTFSARPTCNLWGREIL